MSGDSAHEHPAEAVSSAIVEAGEILREGEETAIVTVETSENTVTGRAISKQTDFSEPKLADHSELTFRDDEGAEYRLITWSSPAHLSGVLVEGNERVPGTVQDAEVHSRAE